MDAIKRHSGGSRQAQHDVQLWIVGRCLGFDRMRFGITKNATPQTQSVVQFVTNRSFHALKVILCIIARELIPVWKYHSEWTIHHQQKWVNSNWFGWVMFAIINILISLLLKCVSADSISATNAEEEMVTLYGCGQATKWHFPNITRCPVHLCDARFGTRSDAIRHYKRCHASHSILCPICDKPIISQSPCVFVRHFKRLHPGVKVPFGMGSQISSKVRDFKWFNCNITIICHA